jgi:ubiquinone/menaquinone biosynthesis C-methylase UbiE
MNIDPLARWYRFLEYCAFGRALERRRFEYLERLAGARKILILGEGDGRALKRLLEIAPAAFVDVVELSGKMIELARSRAGTTNRVRFLRQDARAITPGSRSYDGIMTCFFLDCFSADDAGAIIKRLAGALTADGIWLMTDFEVPERGWRRWYAALWIGTMYRFFQITTGLGVGKLPPVGRLLKEAGLKRVARKEERGGMIVSEVWRLDREIAQDERS